MFLEHGTRRLHTIGVTTRPTQDWTVPQARNLAADLGTRMESLRFLLRDRDGKCGKTFDTVFEAEELRVHDLLGQGVGLLDCSRRLGVALNTVKRYARMPEPQVLRITPTYRPTLVDPYRDHLRARRAAHPAVPVTRLLAEIRELGYTGSANLLVRYLNQGRAEGDRPVTPAASCSPNLGTCAQRTRHCWRQSQQPAQR